MAVKDFKAQRGVENIIPGMCGVVTSDADDAGDIRVLWDSKGTETWVFKKYQDCISKGGAAEGSTVSEAKEKAATKLRHEQELAKARADANARIEAATTQAKMEGPGRGSGGPRKGGGGPRIGGVPPPR